MIWKIFYLINDFFSTSETHIQTHRMLFRINLWKCSTVHMHSVYSSLERTEFKWEKEMINFNINVPIKARKYRTRQFYRHILCFILFSLVFIFRSNTISTLRCCSSRECVWIMKNKNTHSSCIFIDSFSHTITLAFAPHTMQFNMCWFLGNKKQNAERKKMFC